MNDHLLTELREANPVQEGDLDRRLDRNVLRGLRDGILATEREQSAHSEAPRRNRRQSVLAAVAASFLLGGGAAYAAYHQLYMGDEADDITCLRVWEGADRKQRDASVGTALTDDPVTDCQRHQKLNRKPPISNPVAFRYDGYLYVTPESEVPEGATLLDPARPAGLAMRELSTSLNDVVDGIQSECFTPEAARGFVNRELARLRLRDWAVIVRPQPPIRDRAENVPCTVVFVETDRRTIVIFPGRPGEVGLPKEVQRQVFRVRDVLRARVSGSCVNISTAEKIIRRIVEPEARWPIVAEIDAAAPCTRADMEVGDGVQITLRGPVDVDEAYPKAAPWVQATPEPAERPRTPDISD